jgi:hypothetical protein
MKQGANSLISLTAKCRIIAMSKVVFAGVIALSAFGLTAKAADILDQNDAASKRTLTEMGAIGELSDKQNAEAWIVISSVATGMGLEQCNFPSPDDMTFMWRPASDSMSKDEIYTLNRLVTSNFRNAERSQYVLLDRLFPVTRQAVLILSDGKGTWNCREISRVWDAARNYNRARSEKPQH